MHHIDHLHGQRTFTMPDFAICSTNQLLEMLISLTIGSLICMGSVQYLFLTLKIQTKIQQQFSVQHAQLIARHYITRDLQQGSGANAVIVEADMQQHLITRPIEHLLHTNMLKPHSSILSIYGHEQNIIYYLRKSIVPTTLANGTYALYRDEIVHNAQALLENIVDFQVEITPLDKLRYKILVRLMFPNQQQQEITCILHYPLATP